MTVATTNNRNDYTATAAQTTFPYTFRIFAGADLKVYVNSTLKTLTTDYTVTGADSASGGNVVFNTGLTAGDAVAIIRSIAYTQSTDYVENDPFPAETHEKALDRLTMLTQQLTEVDDRSVKLAISSTMKNIELPLPGSGEFIRWNSAGTNLETVPLSSLPSATYATSLKTLPTITDLRAEDYAVSTRVFVLGHTSSNDGGGGVFMWDAASSATDNSGTIIKPTAISTGNPGRWLRIYSGAVNVKWFGATGDGSTDDTSKLQAAISAVVTTGGACYIPAGRYKFTSNITATAPVLLFGDGPEASELLSYTNASLVFNGGTPVEYSSNQLYMKDMSVRVNGQHTGAVIDVNFTGGSGGTAISAIFDSVEVTGDAANSGFEAAFDLFNARNVRFRNVRILGERNNTLTSDFGIKIAGDSDPVDCFLHSCSIYFTRTAISISGTTEGIYVSESAIVAGHTGIDWTVASGSEPLLSVLGCHINTGLAGIKTTSVVQYDISHNLIYGQNNGGVATTQYNGIQVTHDAVGVNALGRITGNAIQGILTGIPKNGIVVDGTGIDVAIVDNNIIDGFDTGILLQAAANGVQIGRDNIFTNCTASVTNNGTGNRVASSTLTTIGQNTNSTGLIEKWGSSVVTLDANGDGTVTFGTAFPTAFLWGSVNNGDPAAQGAAAFSVNQGASTASALKFSVRANPGAVTVRVNWSARGH